MVTLATAHPAKFPAAVEQASGIHPALPDRMSDLMERDERFTVLPDSVSEIETFISSRSRATA
jgi:threonine synthase